MIKTPIGNKQEATNFPLPLSVSLQQEVSEVYRAVGKMLRRYTTGSLPKAFKAIPLLTNWDSILFTTEPERWTPHATFQASRIFCTTANEKVCQQFLARVMLPRMRDDIKENKTLHSKFGESLKVAVQRPAAFYRGILIP